ncbi:hypothetical protein [Citrobacter sp. R56]|uniref:hypothetical protein n=1 Tax=Citrobacter sp. R56 TaxID=1573676 RepID=UPI00193B6E3B|nr:hypothetical protein [Citrobacter sp. R56]QRG77615.1 hypothetical protein JM656_13350 [Citrobacter sp. R56]
MELLEDELRTGNLSERRSNWQGFVNIPAHLMAAQLDPWGNVLSEDNPKKMEQPLRLPGQWYDEESDLLPENSASLN